MKLYAVTLSPFAARARLALRIKGIAYDQEAPLGGSTRSPEHLALNPIGKIPVLVTDDGLVIAESETIIDYLDEQFPTPSLVPASVADRVAMRTTIRIQESYVVPALQRLFAQRDPATQDKAIVAAELAQLHKGLSLLQHFVGDAPFVVGDAVSKADCLVLPTLLLVGVAGHMFGESAILGEYPALAGYIDKARQHPDMGAVWDETEAGLRALAG